MTTIMCTYAAFIMQLKMREILVDFSAIVFLSGFYMRRILKLSFGDSKFLTPYKIYMHYRNSILECPI